MATTAELTWTKPGAGQWKWESVHMPGSPTPLQQALLFPSMKAGMAAMFERYGVPLQTFALRLVNDKVYWRLLPLVGAEKDAPPPPPAVLRALIRLHPAFRRRNANAARAMSRRIWRGDLDRWNTGIRDQWLAANLDLQDEDVAALDDAALAGHLRRVFEHAATGARVHLELHGADLFPLGDLLAHCLDWGIEPADAMALLEGASPASTAPARALESLGAMVAGAAEPPASLDDVRALGPDAAGQLDAYLRQYGWHLVTSYDIDGRCLVELPQVVLAAIRAAAAPRPPARPDPALEERLRAQVPAGERRRFDDLLVEARLVYGLRDDNGPLTAEWPLGLLRRAVVETGRRAHARGGLSDPEHACELGLEELVASLTGGPVPSAAAVAERAARRAELAALRPPATLGEPEAVPPLDVFPPALARTVRVAICASTYIDAPAQREPMVGLGIGDTPYVGTARLAEHPEDVLGVMEQGDVLVVRFTNPAFNCVLAAAGAIVAQEGGPLSHAAIMARELRVPAVIGAGGAMSRIKDGDTVEVDPRSGRVRTVL